MVKEIAKRVGRMFTVGLALLSLFGLIGTFAFFLYSDFVCMAEGRDVDFLRGATLLCFVILLWAIPFCWDIFFPRPREFLPEPSASTETLGQKLLVAGLFFIFVLICLFAIGITFEMHGNPMVVLWIPCAMFVAWIVFNLGKRLAPLWRKKGI